MNNRLKFESSYKSFEWLNIQTDEERDAYNTNAYKKDISILYVPANCRILIDLEEFNTSKPTLFFCGYQRIQILEGLAIVSLNYSRDFYCIQIHDAEVPVTDYCSKMPDNFPQRNFHRKKTWSLQGYSTKLVKNSH